MGVPRIISGVSSCELSRRSGFWVITLELSQQSEPGISLSDRNFFCMGWGKLELESLSQRSESGISRLGGIVKRE
jgi:hypothetical protein